MPILIHKFIQINLIILSILTSKFNIFLFKFELGKIIGTIRNEITTNNILVLKNLELIYSSLYDLLNQDFMKIDDKYYTRN